MLKNLLLVGAGGFAGSVSRYLIYILSNSYFKSRFPIGTIIVNITGCFFFGLLSGYIEKSAVLSHELSILLVIGFCGAFTTFSAFSGDILNLHSKAGILMLMLYGGVSVLGGILMTIFGRYIIS